MHLIRWSASAGLLLLYACRSAAPGEQGSGFPPDERRLREASSVAQAWASAPEAELGAFTHLAVDSRGGVYVPDFHQNRVVVFSPDGRVVRTIGRRGSGPGEFRTLRTVQVIAGDSLLTFDSGLGRVAVFAPHGGQPAYVVNLRGATPWAVERTRTAGAYVARYEPRFEFGGDPGPALREDRVSVLNADGSPRAELLRFPARSFVVARQSVMPNPWGGNGFTRLDGSDRLHYAWSDTLGVATYDLQGRRVGGFRVNYVPPPATRADLHREMAALPAMARGMFSAALEDSLPSRWPAVRGLLVDDRGRVWLELAGPADRPVEWVAFTPAGKYRGSALFPPGTSVHAIHGDRAFARSDGADGTPRLVAYRIVRPPR